MSLSADQKAFVAFIAAGDYEGAVPHLMSAIRKDDGEAMGIYGAMCAMGRGVPADPTEAALWFRQSAARGFPKYQLALALCLIRGLGAAENKEEAAYWLVQSARAGNQDAVKSLADLALSNKAAVEKHITIEEVGRMEVARMKVQGRTQASSMAS